MDGKRWSIFVILGSGGLLLMVALFNMVVDPFLHYHRPLEFLEYPMLDERYLNDGIARNYTYDAVITGSSMAQNFKASQMEQLWNVPAIKVACSGATLHELAQNVERVLRYHPETKYVVMSLDVTMLNRDKDEMEYTGYPDYLYDSNPFNDVEYVLNKEVVPKTIAVLNYTWAGNHTVSMDEYGSFDQYMQHGRENVFRTWTRMEIVKEEYVLSAEDKERIRENVSENIYRLAAEHPDTEFYLFFPPYSICYWDMLIRSKQINADMEERKIACGLLTGIPNVHLFEFSDKVEMIEDLDNYSDALHYAAWVNDYMLQSMYEGKHELKADDYERFYEKLAEVYKIYDYSRVLE